MQSKNVYLIQPGYTFGGSGKKGAYLPYAAGTIAAYAWSDETIKTRFTLKGFLYRFDDIDEKIAELENPFLAGFSNYVWNFEYNKQFARKLKSVYPECIVVFGGHQVPPAASLLDECEYIDFLVHGEGEEPFALLLKQLIRGGVFESVPNISYRNTENKAVQNRDVSFGRTDYPSPYLSGIFDSLVQSKDIEYYAIIETNRGCPFRCSYCDWGITKTAVKIFPEERILKEIQWISEHKIEYCFAADANFGILDRDERIADFLIDSKRETGFPSRFDVTYSKGREEIVFLIAKKLYDAGMFKGPSLSFQTLCTAALDSVGRSNMTLDSYAGLLSLYSSAGITPYSEMILGLPGETYESFCKGIGTLLRLGQHNYIDIFRCELLVNAPMSDPAYIKKHGIKFVRTPSIQHHIEPRTGSIYGYSDIVVETNTMSTGMWLKANLFALIVQCCHHMGLLKYFAIYLHHSNRIGYEDFYNAFLEWLWENGETFSGNIFRTMKTIYETFLETGAELSYVNQRFGNLTWFPEEGAFLECVLGMDSFYRDAVSFLNGYALEKEIFNDLLRFQQHIIKQPGIKKADIPLDYDWHQFFSGSPAVSGNPVKNSNILHIVDEDNPDNWEEYARENVWFGRRAGKTVFLNSSYLKVEYIK